jgi:hypothetical protein
MQRRRLDMRGRKSIKGREEGEGERELLGIVEPMER